MLSPSSLTFGNGAYLWALLFVIPLVFLFYWTEEKKKNLLSKIVAMRLRRTLVGGVSTSKRWIRFLFLLLAFVFALLALAQPRMGYEEREVKSQGRDVIAVIDVSRSMLSTDIAPTRLARAQLLGQDLLELLPGDRIGLVAFAGRGFLEAPLTLDHAAISDALTELDMNLIPKGGTNIADALEVAMSAFGKSEGSDRSIVLITDGEELEASGVAKAKEAAARNIKIFTIGIGSAEGSLIPIKNELGKNDFVRDEHGKPVLSKLDVARLEEIAKVTGGFYEPFGPEAMRTIVEKGIMPLNAKSNSVLNIRRPQERYAWPLGVALFFLTLWCLSSEKRKKGIKKNSALVLLLLGFFSSSGQAAPGISAYDQGDYVHALQDFERQLQSGSSSQALRFNAGAAAYKQQDYKKAEAYFTEAMTSSSKKLQEAATYNLANTLVRQGEAAQKKADKLANWNNALQHYETVLKIDPHNKNAQENRDLVKKMIEKLKNEKDQEPPQSTSKGSSQDQNNQKEKKDQQKNNQNSQDNQNDQQQGQQNNQKQNEPQEKTQNAPSNGSSGKEGSPQNPDKKTEETPPQGQQQGNSSLNQQKNQQNNQQDQQQKNSENESSPSEPNKDAGSNKQNNNSSSTPSQPKENRSSGGQQEKEKQSSSQGQGNQPNTPPLSSEKKKGALSGGEQEKQEEVNAATEKEGDNNSMSPSQAEAVLRSVEDEERRVPFSQQQQNDEETTKDW